MKTRTLVLALLPLVLGVFGALLGILAAGQLGALPVSDNESMTVQVNHLVKQAAYLTVGGLVGAATGGIMAIVGRRIP